MSEKKTFNVIVAEEFFGSNCKGCSELVNSRPVFAGECGDGKITPERKVDCNLNSQLEQGISGDLLEICSRIRSALKRNELPLCQPIHKLGLLHEAQARERSTEIIDGLRGRLK